jgi:hypothetical protein
MLSNASTALSEPAIASCDNAKSYPKITVSGNEPATTHNGAYGPNVVLELYDCSDLVSSLRAA